MKNLDYKLERVYKFSQLMSKMDNLLFELLSNKLYEKYVNPLYMMGEDMIFLTLFGLDYDSIDKKFATPGMNENEKFGKVILWDKKNGGYPLEKLRDILVNKNSEKDNKKLFKKMKYQVDLINKSLKKHNKR